MCTSVWFEGTCTWPEYFHFMALFPQHFRRKEGNDLHTFYTLHFIENNIKTHEIFSHSSSILDFSCSSGFIRQNFNLIMCQMLSFGNSTELQASHLNTQPLLLHKLLLYFMQFVIWHCLAKKLRRMLLQSLYILLSHFQNVQVTSQRLLSSLVKRMQSQWLTSPVSYFGSLDHRTVLHFLHSLYPLKTQPLWDSHNLWPSEQFFKKLFFAKISLFHI